ncbi:BZ3500_MvSof-1268-A1-R1_Chr3-1g05812 [Microbotryum saponariae]|uniref:UDP-glucose 4-epimerase n=1 Tax=Microbotryum saponariae TaxID=289078 RepID=A0A2X0LJD7_9BASI|nr:BZ3500_MvSof-1268-A1-R1_Chr3-1g05812 [Microbotryum saponariae]SDA05002.1 BZ3501_MvSof-1269-A2-R1_Chr3-1g05482 [Microbotryum saponariae]
MARKNILVTGAAGYIGSHIALCCLLSGQYSVVTIDNFSNSFPTAMTRVSKLAVEALPADASDEEKKACQIDVVKGDITIKSDIEKIFEAYKAKGGIWGVIHVAALKAVGESAEKPIQYYEANITATINLLDVMARHQVYNIVYSSSATVYGAPQQIPIPETSVLAPESVYGRTKHMSELIIKDVCDSNPDTWRAIGLRYFNPAGAHPSGEIGEDPRGKPGNLLPLLAQMAVGKFAKEGLKIFGNDYPTPDGTCVRDYIHVMDLAQGHVDALAALTRDSTYASLGTQKSQFGGSGGKYKAYNLGKGKGMSVLQMVEAMRVASGFEYKYEIVGRRVGDVPDLTADPALAEKEMGFKAPRNLQEMCRDQWNWQSKNPKGYEGQEE